MENNNNKKGLGRGLGALFSNNPLEEISQEKNDIDNEKKIETFISDNKIEINSENEILYVDINKITPNQNQPRKVFEDDKLEELSESIKIHGVIQPILVKKIEQGYEIIAGERRWRASRKAGLKQIPCILKEYDNRDLLLVALIENMQREDLNPMEEAKAFQYMMDNFKLTQDEIAKNVGKSRPYIGNFLRLLKLPETIIDLIYKGEITAGHGRTLLSLTTEKQQNEVALLIIKRNLSVRQTEKLVSEMTANKKKKEKSKEEKSVELYSIESELKDAIGSDIKINEKKDKGKIEISFYNREELERLIELLLSTK